MAIHSAGVNPPAEFALWNLGFRPFYLLGSIFAALSIALWIGQYAGYLPFAYLRSPASHGSEMLLGIRQRSWPAFCSRRCATGRVSLHQPARR